MKILLVGPINSISGYGERTRSLLYDLKSVQNDIKIHFKILNWGKTYNLYKFRDNSETDLTTYDVIFHVDIPASFNKYTYPDEVKSKLVFVTAGYETNQEWAAPSVKYILGSSHHSIKHIQRSSPDQIVRILPETTDTDFFKEMSVAARQSELIPNVLSDYNFVIISGAWIHNVFGEDRKNIPWSIDVTLRGLMNREKIGIIVQSSMGAFTALEKQYMTDLIRSIVDRTQDEHPDANLPPILFLHGYSTNINTIGDLYKDERVKWMIALTHGEGFGRHITEFMAAGGRVLTVPYSAPYEYSNSSDNRFVSGIIRQIHPVNASVYLDEKSEWFYPDHKDSIEMIQSLEFNLPDSTLNQSIVEGLNTLAIETLKEILSNFK